MDITKSIEQLENDYWPEYIYETTMVRKCHELRKVPLNKLSPEDIRLLIGQNIGTEYILPIALNILEEDPFYECIHFPGDLLMNVVDTDSGYWDKNVSDFERLIKIFSRIEVIFEKERESHDLSLKIKNEIREKFEKILGKQ